MAAVEQLGLHFIGGVHAAAHALMLATRMLVPCDPADLGCECVHSFQTRERPLRLVLFDRRPGGTGVCDAAFDCMDTVVQRALDVVRSCLCAEAQGCPGCVQDPRCTEYNYVLDRPAARALLGAVHQTELDARGSAGSPAGADGSGTDGDEGAPRRGQEGRGRVASAARGSPARRRPQGFQVRKPWHAAVPTYCGELASE